MGYVLFTANGTFNPSDYGLVPGDMLNVVCVGGGAGGLGEYNGAKYAGGAGSASSFGGFVSAAGGAAHTTSGAVAPRAFGRAGLGSTQYFVYDSGSTNAARGCGAAGAPGWMPGTGLVPYPAPVLLVVYPFNPNSVTEPSVTAYFTGMTGPQIDYVEPNGKELSAGPNYGGCGRGNHYSRNVTVYGPCPGGYGYGAGGGGGSNGNSLYCRGGNSGSVIEASVKLPSSAGIAVTVGKGGHSSTVVGAGAPGCVAVFW